MTGNYVLREVIAFALGLALLYLYTITGGRWLKRRNRPDWQQNLGFVIALVIAGFIAARITHT